MFSNDTTQRCTDLPKPVPRYLVLAVEHEAMVYAFRYGDKISGAQVDTNPFICGVLWQIGIVRT